MRDEPKGLSLDIIDDVIVAPFSITASGKTSFPNGAPASAGCSSNDRVPQGRRCVGCSSANGKPKHDRQVLTGSRQA